MSFLNQPISITQILFGTKRAIADFTGFITVSESTNDTLTITKQPVQQGATISDHAYKEPTTFSCQITFPGSFGVDLEDLYDDLLNLQESAVPFSIMTPKRTYENMLMATLSQTTDKSTENCLAISMTCQEVIIVSISTVQVPKNKQKTPQQTGKTDPAGNKTALAAGTGSSGNSIIPSFLRSN